MSERGSDLRVRFADVFDDETREQDEALRRIAAIGPDDRVLDVGCGTGTSTRTAARAAKHGGALGVDVSEVSIGHARRLAAAEGLTNVRFEVADAQTHCFEPESFDACISAFGVMFFADPHAAFDNLAAALRPGGRLTALVWQPSARNEWPTAEQAVLGSFGDDEPYSLGEPDVVRDVLRAFDDVELTEVHAPVRFGPDVPTALELVLGLRGPSRVLAGLSPEDAESARTRMRELLEQHKTAEGVLFDSYTWIISARRR